MVKKKRPNSTTLLDEAPESMGTAAVCLQITDMLMCNKPAYLELKLGNKADMTSSSKQTWESPASAVQSPDTDLTLVKHPLSTADPAPEGRKCPFSRLETAPRLQSRCFSHILCSETGLHGANSILMSSSIKRQSKPYYPRPSRTGCQTIDW